ncbi:MAG: hypothetical protein ACI9OJ_001244 [Myxococcota bacterium]|jgi:hypothetical protein
MQSKATTIMLAFVAGALFFTASATAQTPGIISFHGYLSDLSGNAIDAPEGKDFTVRMYHESEGSNPFWEDDFPGRPVVGGVFRILLGSSNNAVPTSHFDGAVKYIGVTVDNGEELSPRLQLVTVPYALRADTADTANSASFADSAAALGGVAAADFAQKSELAKYDAYESQIAALQAKVDLLESTFSNPGCTNGCTGEGSTGCSDDFAESYVCVKAADSDCLEQHLTICSGDDLCHAGVCTCKPAQSTACGLDGNVYSIDSCSQQQEQLSECDPGQCSDGKCVKWLLETPLQLSGMQDSFVMGGHLYAVGTSGRALHYDGNQWTQMSTGTTKNLYGVWGYQEGALHKLFAVGETGKVLFYDGAKWSTVVTGSYSTLREVFGLSASNVLAVGDGGTVLRYNGADWMPVAWDEANHPWFATDFHAVWAHSSSQIWVAGAGGAIIHNDGTQWSAQTTPDSTPAIQSLWGISADSVWAAAGDKIVKLQSGEWTTDTGVPVDLETNFNAIWVELSGNLSLYALSDNGQVFTFDGLQWNKQDIVSQKLGDVDFHGVMGGTGAPNGGVWLVAESGQVAYRDPSEKWVFPTVTEGVNALYGVTGQPNNTFAMGNNCLALRHDGSEWGKATVEGDCAGHFNAIWGDGSAGTLMAVGDGGLFKVWAADVWSDGDGPAGAGDNHDIWGLDASSLFVVRASATHIYDGVSWQNTGGGGGRAGFGTSMSDFHVVTGTDGSVHSFDGSEWTIRVVSNQNLTDIWGNASEIWAVGDNGAAYQNVGGEWLDRSINADVSGSLTDLKAVWTGTLTPVYVGAENGHTYIFNGSGWTHERTTPNGTHSSVYGVDPANVLLGGQGTIFRRK